MQESFGHNLSMVNRAISSRNERVKKERERTKRENRMKSAKQKPNYKSFQFKVNICVFMSVCVRERVYARANFVILLLYPLNLYNEQ